MLNIVIIGGKLQGTEVAYLGRKAGFRVTLIDKDPNTPAQKMCDSFISEDISAPSPELINHLVAADMIIPTLENFEALEHIVSLCRKLDMYNKLAFDMDAYKTSSSKIISDKLFHENSLPAPAYYPDGKFPYIAKPSGDSGSHGVAQLNTEEELKRFLSENREDYIIQEFVEGPSYSVEVIGVPGNYRTYALTEIFVDDGYDCNSVGAPRDIDKSTVEDINKIAVRIAGLIELKGIMDLEVIVMDGDVMILEIDARFPSQTPIVVYHASGMNYVKELYDITVNADFNDEQRDDGLYASLIHYLVRQDSYISLGEHIMTEGGILDYTEGITKEAEVITDYMSGREEWRSTFIYSAKSPEELTEKAKNIQCDLDQFLISVRSAV